MVFETPCGRRMDERWDGVQGKKNGCVRVILLVSSLHGVMENLLLVFPQNIKP